MESRIEELTSQLNQTNKDKSDTSRMQRSADKVARDAKFQLAESDRQRAKLEDERKAYEAQILSLRQAMDSLVRFFPSVTHFIHQFPFQQTGESNLQSAKRRAEREAVDYKQKALK
jgi:myosin protein heavy chain